MANDQFLTKDAIQKVVAMETPYALTQIYFYSILFHSPRHTMSEIPRNKKIKGKIGEWRGDLRNHTACRGKSPR